MGDRGINSTFWRRGRRRCGQNNATYITPPAGALPVGMGVYIPKKRRSIRWEIGIALLDQPLCFCYPTSTIESVVFFFACMTRIFLSGHGLSPDGVIFTRSETQSLFRGTNDLEL